VKRNGHRAPKATPEQIAAAEARANAYQAKLVALMSNKNATPADWDALYLEMGK
jgi:hypothetical protein